jgi:hypothetical protein
VAMAKLITCPCGWTIISPQGEDDVRKHAAIHMRDARRWRRNPSLVQPAVGLQQLLTATTTLVEAAMSHGGKIHPDMRMTREQFIGMAKTE